MSRSVSASSSSTGRAAPRSVRIGFAGSTIAATTSATTPPVSASSDAREGEAGARGGDREDEHGRDRDLVDEQLAGAEEHAQADRDRDRQRQLGHARAEQVGQQVGGGDPDRDRDRQLDRAAAALVVARAERDHRRDRGEERLLVTPEPLRDRPGERDRDAGLHHRAPARAHALPARVHRHARAFRRALEQPVRDHNTRRYSTRSSPSSGSGNAREACSQPSRS